MIKQIKYLIIVILVLPLWAKAQDTCFIKGFVFDTNTGLPVNDVYIECDIPKKSLITDASGRFRFDSLNIGKHRIKFISSKGSYIDIDSTIYLTNDSIDMNVNMAVKEDSYCLDYNKMAKQAIKYKTIVLYRRYGQKSTLSMYEEQLDFERKYNVTYQINAGSTPYTEYCLRAYNNIIAAYLTKTYGEGWKKEVREDVIF